MADDMLLTLEDVAKILRVSIATVRRLINERQLKAIKIRGQLRVWQSDLNEYLKSRQ